MTFQELAANRFSCRKFSDREVAPELIKQIVDTALTAPTAVNYQPFKIFQMASEAAQKQIRACTTCSFGARNFLVVGYRTEDAWVRKYDGRNFADVDASIVATHIMMEIADLGLGTTWVGHFDAPALKASCPAMADYELIAIFPIGYPAEDAVPSPRHLECKPRAELFEAL